MTIWRQGRRKSVAPVAVHGDQNGEHYANKGFVPPKRKKGDTIVELEAEKTFVQLIGTYDNQKTLEEMIYVITARDLGIWLADCQKL